MASVLMLGGFLLFGGRLGPAHAEAVLTPSPPRLHMERAARGYTAG
ncbi:hypothetical protein [Jiangella asiatica]|nr:hypothetical protein [Jiangella asiatica]